MSLVGRWLAVALVAAALAAPARAQPVFPGTDPESSQWAVTLGPTALHGDPAEDSDSFGEVRALSPLQILGYQEDWAYVYNPRTKGTAYVRSDALGPSDPPSDYVAADPPPVEEEISDSGLAVDGAALAFYPTPDPAAVAAPLDRGARVVLNAKVQGDDGETWYRTDDGYYLRASAVYFPPPPPPPAAPTVSAVAPRPTTTFAGRWIDVNLTEPARLTAYEGDTPVRSMLVIKGRSPGTPSGVFRIQRRVANETMDSSTIGIPRNGPGGYYLKNVLYTQYFLPTGESIHYNYWSSNFGYAGSHGCLGLSLADSKFLWDWANIGTPVSIHY